MAIARSLVLILLFVGAASFLAADTPRFHPQERVLDGPATWIAIDNDRFVFGAGERLTIATVRPELTHQSTTRLGFDVTAGVLAGADLYAVKTTASGDSLVIVDLASPRSAPRETGLAAAAGAMRIAQMDDYVVVAGNRSLRVLQIPSHHAMHGGHAGHRSPVVVGELSLDEPIHAVGATLRTLWVVVDGGLIEVEAVTPSALVEVRRVPHESDARAISANRDRVYLLGDDGLLVLDTSTTPVKAVSHDPGVSGAALTVLGRSAFVATGVEGVRRFQDTEAGATTVFIAVGDVFFSPAGAVNINSGDTVEWQKPGTIAPHNVFSCNAAQAGCSAQTATETFTSGAFTTAAFNFSHTFTAVGNNPYVCQAHTLTMQGDIVVSAAPATPPAVADGSGVTSPLTVSKLSPGGAGLQIQFDAGCPDAVRYDLVFGTSTQLPASLGGTYGTTGGRCNPAANPFAWDPSPNVASGDFIWWVMVADDGGSLEGSWGQDSAGNERDGAGVNGASTRCGNTDKDISNACGQ